MTNCIIYSRVSSTNDRQDLTRQNSDLNIFAESRGYEISKTFSEKISGAKKTDDRPALKDLLSYVQDNKVDKVLVWELSRLGRNTSHVLSVIEYLTELGISIYIHNYNMETLDSNGKVNPITALITTVISSFAQLERESIKSRLESGYKNARLNGIKVGRKTNYIKPTETFKSENEETIKLLRKGYSIRIVAKLTNKSLGTVQKVKNTFINEAISTIA